MNEPSFDAKSPVAMKDSDIWTRLANGGGAFDAKPPVANGGSDKPGTIIVCVEEPDQCSFIGTVSDPTPFDWVLRYIARGWHPVPVPYMGKRPVTKAWQNQHIDAGNATEFFKPRGRWNIGVQLGPFSNNLIDADLDCPEAVDIAPRFFPGTNAVFGRARKKHSHALYYSPSLVGCTAKASLQFLDPDIADKQKAMLLELRCGGNNGKGAQSVFPGSVHSSNELIFWHAFGEPALIDGEVLRTAANLTASASLLIRGWPGPGAMHNAALVVGSFLARLGWTIPQAESFLTIVLEGAGANPEAVRCVEKLADEEPMPGFPRLAEVFGEKRAKSIAEWLGYKKCPERQVLERPHVTEIEPGQLSDTICLDPGNLPYVIRAMEDRLLEHPELSLYQRGGRMTKIHEDTFKRPDETVTTALVIDEVEKYELLLDVTRVALFDRHNERGEDVPADPTTVHINTLMALKYRSRLPRLTGVIESPLLLPNGRLIEEHGYDEATGLFFDTGGVEFPRIPQRPDKTECLAALKLLDDSLLSEFPFVDETSHSVALSGLLTGVSRPALMLVPMHAYSAPEAGTGKSYLADLVVLLATGRLAAAINAGKDEEELEKRLDGLLLKSINNVVISNIYDAIECAKLSDLLSQRRLHVRMLGGNSAKHMRVIENYAFVQATGNNLKIEGELGRRTLYCEMDAKCERPELRGFQQKPHELLMKNRGPYVSAANTILRGLRCSGFPPQEPLNNYEDWCARVRDALVWLGREDSVKSQEKIRGRDAKLRARQGLMTFWRDRYGETRRTAGEVIKEAIAEQAVFNKIRFKGEYPPNLSLVETGADCVAINTAHQQKWDLMMAKPSFFDALLQVCEDKGKLSATRFGKWLDGNAGRIAGGYCFQKDGTAHGGAVYWKCAKP